MPQLPGHIANQCHRPALLDTGLGLSSNALSKAMGSSLLIAKTVLSALKMTTTMRGHGTGVQSVLSKPKRQGRIAVLRSFPLLYSTRTLEGHAKARV